MGAVYQLEHCLHLTVIRKIIFWNCCFKIPSPIMERRMLSMRVGQWIEEDKAVIQRSSGEVVISLPSFSGGC